MNDTVSFSSQLDLYFTSFLHQKMKMMMTTAEVGLRAIVVNLIFFSLCLLLCVCFFPAAVAHSNDDLPR